SVDGAVRSGAERAAAQQLVRVSRSPARSVRLAGVARWRPARPWLMGITAPGSPGDSRDFMGRPLEVTFAACPVRVGSERGPDSVPGDADAVPGDKAARVLQLGNEPVEFRAPAHIIRDPEQ